MKERVGRRTARWEPRALLGACLISASCGSVLAPIPAAAGEPESLRPTRLCVAGAQIPVTRDILANVAAIRRAIDYAAANHADILLTPEGSLSGYVHDFDASAVRRALEDVLTRAREVHLALALGVCFEELDDHRRYDQLRFYDQDGNYLGFHSKILLCRRMSDPAGTPGELDLFATRPLQTFRLETPGPLTVGGLICNDLWANPEWTPQNDPHLTQQLAALGTRVIFHAVNSGLGEGDELALNRQFHEANLRLRARAGRQWIVVADAADPEKRRPNQCFSGVMDPRGNWAARVEPLGEQFFVHTIQFKATIEVAPRVGP